jgi:hypothetical protein
MQMAITRTPKKVDLLLENTEMIARSAKEQGLIVFYGWAHEIESKAIYWNEAQGGDWTKFLECAKSVGAKQIYLNWAPFEDFQVDEALAQLETALASEAIAKADTPQSLPTRQDLESYREAVGMTAILDLAFIHAGVVHIYQCLSDPFKAFDEITDGLEAIGDFSEDSDRGTVVDKTLGRKWASDLANHAKFGVARTTDQKEFLLEALAGPEIDSLPIPDILAREPLN